MSGRTMFVLGLVVWVVGMPLAHGVVPWAISLLATRYGWIAGRPGMWNLLGLVPVFVGIFLFIWILNEFGVLFIKALGLPFGGSPGGKHGVVVLRHYSSLVPSGGDV